MLSKILCFFYYYFLITNCLSCAVKLHNKHLLHYRSICLNPNLKCSWATATICNIVIKTSWNNNLKTKCNRILKDVMQCNAINIISFLRILIFKKAYIVLWTNTKYFVKPINIILSCAMLELSSTIFSPMQEN